MKWLWGGLLVILLAGAGYYFLYIRNRSANITFGFEKPDLVMVGQPFSLSVNYANQSGQALKNASLAVMLPDNVVFVGRSAEQRVSIDNLGDLAGGSSGKKTVDLLVVGDPQSVKQIGVKLDYAIPGTGSGFTQEDHADISVGQPAVAFSFQFPQSVFSGQSFEGDLMYRNNSTYDFKNVSIVPDFPPAYRIEKSDPAQNDMGSWDIADLPPGAQGKVHIKGSVVAASSGAFTFGASLKTNLLGQDYVLGKMTNDLNISTPPLSLHITVNDDPNYIAHIGDVLQYNISYRNNSDTAMQGASIKAALIGDMFDMASVQTDGAFNSVANSVAWSAANAPALQSIAPGQSGTLNMQVKVKDNFPIRRLSDKNFTLKIAGSIESPTVPQGVSASKTFSIANSETKIAGVLQFNSQAYFNDASMANGGPYPPRVNQPTKYTVHWKLVNYSTDMSNIHVSAFLQSGARFTNKVKSNVGTSTTVYNANTGEVTWDIPLVLATQGITGAPPEAIFQVEVTPASNQVGQDVVFLSGAHLAAHDNFINANVKADAGSISTALPDDLSISATDRRVKP